MTEYLCRDCGKIFEAENPLKCPDCKSANIITYHEEKNDDD
ncbi:MAG: hypothetical protein AB1393_09515 [Candidatus Edwardsbacteria bacterium]